MAFQWKSTRIFNEKLVIKKRLFPLVDICIHMQANIFSVEYSFAVYF